MEKAVSPLPICRPIIHEPWARGDLLDFGDGSFDHILRLLAVATGGRMHGAAGGGQHELCCTAHARHRVSLAAPRAVQLLLGTVPDTMPRRASQNGGVLYSDGVRSPRALDDGLTTRIHAGLSMSHSCPSHVAAEGSQGEDEFVHERMKHLCTRCGWMTN